MVISHYDDYILMQCTGLGDSEGTLIWEGDIVESTEGFRKGDRAIVTWHKVQFRNDPIGKISARFAPMKHVKVIGNIYEHSHLITQPGREGL